MSAPIRCKLVSNSMIINKSRARLKLRPSSSSLSSLRKRQHESAIYHVTTIRERHLNRRRPTAAVAVTHPTTAIQVTKTLAPLHAPKFTIINRFGIIVAVVLGSIHLSHNLASAYRSGGGGDGSGRSSSGERMVRLCIASVDPIKLPSQCVMCNRGQFPVTAIGCTGKTKVNDLIASPLSVQDANCLIHNCRLQVTDVKPEPYHGSVSHAVNYRGASSNYHHHPSGMGGPVSGSSIYEMMTPSGMFGGGVSPMYPPYPGSQSQQSPMASSSPYMTRYGSGFVSPDPYQGAAAYSPYSSSASPKGLIGGPSLLGPDRHQQGLPYALVPAPRTFPFGSRKYKAALVPLFK